MGKHVLRKFASRPLSKRTWAVRQVIAMLAVAFVEGDVSCGKDAPRVPTCSKCPPSANPQQVWKWCNGDCLYDEESKSCADKPAAKLHEGMRNAEGYLPSKVPDGDAVVSCGKIQAASCSQCPPSADRKQVWKWCSGECVWNEQEKACGPRAKTQNAKDLHYDEDGY